MPFGGSVISGWSSEGSYSLWLFSYSYKTVSQGDYISISQDIDLTGITDIMFDVRLDTAYKDPFDPAKRQAKVLLNGDTYWASTGTADIRGEYLDESIDVSALSGFYNLELRLESHADGFDYINYRVYWDNLCAVQEPQASPVADAGGPYSVIAGDTLTLDANDSMDDDNDIVSYTWDLDDNNSFETDAGGQAIFDVNYLYLESLRLLIGNTYTIHLKVTDSENQSDVNDSTLTILPKPATVVAVDIKPGSCPNPLNVKSKGVLPVAVLGSEDFDVSIIDVASLQLAGVGPNRSSYEDVAMPVSDSNNCNCITDGPDGFLDLTLKFKTQRIVEAIGDVNHGDVLELELTGVLFDETPIKGADCVVIRGKSKPINRADINKDGAVDMADFAIFAENWLK